MLPTFVIGLREGLEAALIVSIIATFLRRNGLGLRAMWIGVGAAVLLSIGVGVALQAVEQSLPQREQEGMETVIGVVAVVFVTGMILWMRTHARHMKRELETAASAAVGSGTATALAVMAFLAVLREGFETSVFLLSTFQASASLAGAAGGAVLGIVTAIVIGVGIYGGSVRLNLTAFFRYTGIFLVFVAAGLVLSALRTAHEAGWLVVGQGTTLDLSWLAPAGAIRTALISGVLGIPSDPRVVEVLGWLAYLLPMLAITLWPAALRPAESTARRLRVVGAGVLSATAVVAFVAVRYPSAAVPTEAALADGGTATVAVAGDTARLDLARDGHTTWIDLVRPTPTTGTADTRWAVADATPAGLPATLTATRLLTYTGQRAPVGLDLARDPGPFTARWATRGEAVVTTRDGGLVSARSAGDLVLTITGGGLTSPRVLTVDDPAGTLTWRTTDTHALDVSARLADVGIVRGDRALWKHVVPVVLLVGAVLLLLPLRRRRADGVPALGRLPRRLAPHH